MKNIKFVVTSILTLIILIYITMFYFEDKIIFAGTKHSDGYRNESLPQLTQLKFEQKFFRNDFLSIEYFVKNTDSDEYVLFLGGNAEDVIFDLEFLSKTFKYQNIYTLNYPGYGKSEGLSNEDRVTSLLREFVSKTDLKDKKLTVVGRSLGTGFATKIASEFKNTKALVLVSPYYSMENLANEHFPMMPYGLTSLFMKNKIETYKHAQLLNIPVLVIYAKDDNVVLNSHTERLLKVIAQKEVVLVENENHDSVLKADKTIDSIQKFTH
jgi:pimeloyl-ACP methyl ester carboxylesterase